MIEQSTLDNASLPESSDSMDGGTNGAVDGFSPAAIKRGYTVEAVTPDDTVFNDFWGPHHPFDGPWGYMR